MKNRLLSGIACAIVATCAHAADFNPRNFGAKGDGVTLDTAAVQGAIDAAHKAGGGRVVLEGGVFKTGTIYLKSHVEFHLSAGAVLLGSDSMDDYNALDAFPQNGSINRIEGWRAHHLVLCLEQEDVSITGEGTIDGNGRAFFSKTLRKPGKVSWRHGSYNCPVVKEAMRPGQTIEFVESRNLRVKDVRIKDPTAWSCFFHGCEDVQVRGIKVESDICNMNTDGIDIDCCRNVTVSDCIFRTGDDAIAIRGAPARLKDKTRVCENITVVNCIAAVSATGCRIGVGKGVIRHVAISNFIVETAGTGVHVQSVYGKGPGGVDISDVSFVNCSLRDCAVAISVSGVNGTPPRQISFSDMLIEETDIVEGPMIRISEAERPVFRNVRFVRNGGQAREMKESDVAPIPADGRYM